MSRDDFGGYRVYYTEQYLMQLVSQCCRQKIVRPLARVLHSTSVPLVICVLLCVCFIICVCVRVFLTVWMYVRRRLPYCLYVLLCTYVFSVVFVCVPVPYCLYFFFAHFLCVCIYSCVPSTYLLYLAACAFPFPMGLCWCCLCTIALSGIA